MEKIIKQIEKEINEAPSRISETLQHQYVDLYNDCMTQFKDFLQMITDMSKLKW